MPDTRTTSGTAQLGRGTAVAGRMLLVSDSPGYAEWAESIPAPLVVDAAEDAADNDALIRYRMADGTYNSLVVANGEVSVAPQFEAERAFNVYDANGNECFHIEGDGTIRIAAALPTADPNNEGQIWNSSGTLKVSAG